MKNKYFWMVLIVLVAGIISPVGRDEARASHLGAVGEEHPKEKRPLYVYPGNYREEVSRLKEKFKSAFGYELMDLDRRSGGLKRLSVCTTRFPACLKTFIASRV